MNRLFGNAIILLVLFTVSCAGGGSPQQTNASAPQSQDRQQQAAPLWIGDGGMGMSLAILAPRATGLTENQEYIPALVQGEFVSNFSSFSAISVLDRLRLDEQYAELLSGYYSDNAQAGLDLGHLIPTDYIMLGNITRTNTGFAMQISINNNSDKMTAASYSGTFTFAELDNLSGVRKVSLDLLQKLGITPTEQTRTSLSGAAATNHVSAQTALAQGIVAQHRGNTFETMARFYEAVAYAPDLTEAVTRANTMSASISTGNLGENIRNDIAWRDEWVKILAEAEAYIKNYNNEEIKSINNYNSSINEYINNRIKAVEDYIIQNLPLVTRMVYDPNLKHIGTNYSERTAQLSFEVSFLDDVQPPLALDPALYPITLPNPPVLSDPPYLRMIQDLNNGLSATKRNFAWKLNLLSPPVRPSFPANPTIPKIECISIDRDNMYRINASSDDDLISINIEAELLNSARQIIGRFSEPNIGSASLYSNWPFFSVVQVKGVKGSSDQKKTITFTVKADDITDSMTINVKATASGTIWFNRSTNRKAVLQYPVEVMTKEEFLSQIRANGLPLMGMRKLEIKTLNGSKFVVAEVPQTSYEKEYGLSYRPEFLDGYGLLYNWTWIFPITIDATNYHFPVDVATLTKIRSYRIDRANYKISKINTIESGTKVDIKTGSRYYGSDFLVVPKGWFKRNGVRVGDKVF